MSSLKTGLLAVIAAVVLFLAGLFVGRSCSRPDIPAEDHAALAAHDDALSGIAAQEADAEAQVQAVHAAEEASLAVERERIEGATLEQLVRMANGVTGVEQ